MLILGIETSCDETAASVVKDGREILSNIILSSIDLHKKFGGIIPEIAHRFHLKFIRQVVEKALDEANVSLKRIDAIAVTYGPGLMGALLVGVSYAKSASFALDKPLIGVNHLQAHIYAPLMTQDVNFPFIGLVVSGGHTLLVLVKDFDSYRLIGETRDDAAGEAFDKVAKMLNLGYPGVPVIDRLAKGRGGRGGEFPRSYLGRDSFDFSFSGLKTSVLYCIKRKLKQGKLSRQDKVNIASGFQESVVDVLVDKSIAACEKNRVGALVVGGGVSRNSRLKERLLEKAGRCGVRVCFPAGELCLDNAAMISGLAYRKYKKNLISDLRLVPKSDLRI